MRVISGKYKSRRFDVPRSFKARPTTDFAKENLFNVLCNNYIDFDELTALDLFAGTGSIGMELLSRGCSEVISVEKDRAHIKFISSVKKELSDDNWKLLKGDALKFIETCDRKFDFIFADPPYMLPELPKIPEMILSRDMLTDGGIFVMEHGRDNDFSELPHFVEHREYGSVNFSIFRLEA